MSPSPGQAEQSRVSIRAGGFPPRLPQRVYSCSDEFQVRLRIGVVQGGHMRRLFVLIGLTLVVGVAARATLAEDRVLQTIKGGILDEARLYVDKLPASTTVVIRPFSATDADIVEGEKKEETKKMQAEAPKMLA